jgi:hypothetical protein
VSSQRVPQGMFHRERERIPVNDFSASQLFSSCPVDAMVMVEGLKRAGKEPTREGLIRGIESIHD